MIQNNKSLDLWTFGEKNLFGGLIPANSKLITSTKDNSLIPSIFEVNEL